MDEVNSIFRAMPVQWACINSKAKIRGYGGAMGGGKSRTGCEIVFDAALDYPGLVAVIARQAHTSIVETTKKTMMNQVITEGRLITRSRASGGEDYIELWNGSRIHFIGLEDPLRWYSSELGLLFFDECQEIEEDTVLRLMTRLRQVNEDTKLPYPNKTILTFNPGNPGHWLQKWFIQGAERTDFGLYKPELWLEGAIKPIGDAEFFFAKASDNPHLPEGYVDEQLGGMKEWMRRRYLEGLWEFISGKCFFDVDALREYELRARDLPPLFNGVTAGDIDSDVAFRTGRGEKPQSDKIRVEKGSGPLTVWRTPVRRHDDAQGKIVQAHRYVLSIDASSGRGGDYSALEVIDVDDFEQVAEMHLMMETGLVAEEAYRLGRIYNDALIVPELSGGWGLAVEQVLKRLRYPRLYTRKTMDRLSQKWTDRTGWDTTTRTRMVVIEALETAIREREFGLYSLRAINEMGTFVYSEDEKAEAQPGCNDDLVMSLAIGVFIASQIPRQLRKVIEKPYVPQFVTGY